VLLLPAVLTHMHKAWNTISGTAPYAARLSDGSLSITSQVQHVTSKVAELRAFPLNSSSSNSPSPSSSSSSSSTDVLLVKTANAISTAVLQKIGSCITDMVLAEGGLVRGVLCGEVFFLLSRSEQLYAGYRLATRAEGEGSGSLLAVHAADTTCTCVIRTRREKTQCAG
jgi:hypothetical protein